MEQIARDGRCENGCCDGYELTADELSVITAIDLQNTSDAMAQNANKPCLLLSAVTGETENVGSQK